MWRETKILLIDDDKDRRRDLAVILSFLSEDHIACASSEWKAAVDALESSRAVLGVLLGAVSAKGGAVEFRVEKAGIVQAGVGKASFGDVQLVENIKAFADAVQKARPAGAKGTYVRRVAVSSSMGPGVKVDPSSFGTAAN